MASKTEYSGNFRRKGCTYQVVGHDEIAKAISALAFILNIKNATDRCWLHHRSSFDAIPPEDSLISNWVAHTR